MYGLANIILSSLSSNPPCPGIKAPLSLTFDCLLNFDSIRSPNVPKMLIIIAIINQLEVEIESSMYLDTKEAETQQKNRPPKKPSTVLLGEIV